MLISVDQSDSVRSPLRRLVARLVLLEVGRQLTKLRSNADKLMQATWKATFHDCPRGRWRGFYVGFGFGVGV